MGDEVVVPVALEGGQAPQQVATPQHRGDLARMHNNISCWLFAVAVDDSVNVVVAE